MTRSDNRRDETPRPAPGAIAATVAVIIGIATFLVLVGTVTARAAKDALHNADAAAGAPGRATIAAGGAQPAHGATRVTAAAPIGDAQVTAKAASGAVGASRTSAPGRSTSGAVSRSTVVSATSHLGPLTGQAAAPAGGPPRGASSPAFTPPAIVATALTGCTVKPGGGGTVTYSVSFQGGTAWVPGATFKDGAYTLNVVGGQGPNSGLDAVINGAPIQNTADGVQTYVLFPADLVVEARC